MIGIRAGIDSDELVLAACAYRALIVGGVES
jgi:hypothetical protein